MNKEFDSLEDELEDLDLPDDTLLDEAINEEDVVEEEEVEEEVEIEEVEEDLDDEVEEVVLDGEVVPEIIEEEVIDTPPVDDASEALRAEINKLTAKIAEMESNTPVPAQEVVPVDTPEVIPESVDDQYDYVGDIDMDDLTTNPDLFNKLIRTAEDRAAAKATKQAMLNIPNLVIHHIKQQQAITKSVDQFYTENPDMVSIKPTVGHIANNIAAENPDWDADKVFKATAIKTRELLKMPKLSKPKSNKLVTDPKKVGQKSPSRPRHMPARKTKLQQELDEL